MGTVKTTTRIYNFSAGPAMLPLPVLEEVQRDLLALPGVGMSVLEISHRSKTFEAIIEGAEADIRRIAGIGADYHVLFLQGGASLQFSMVPMNLLPPGGAADYLITGIWAQKAAQEAARHGTVRVAASTEAERFSRIPRPEEIRLSADAAYVHMTSNNTIFGTQWKYVPDTGGRPLVADTSSDMFSRPIDVSRYGLIYAGAQKNLGPAGVTLVIVRDDLVKRSPAGLPSMLSYRVHAEHRSLYNTPPVFAIYVLRLVMKWILDQGGLAALERVNERKAAKLYAEIDRTGFYLGHAQPDSRSTMNVTFRLRDEKLESLFVEEATREGLDGLKGHRSVGGLRASIYNAFPEAGVDALVAFMREFERRHG
ncbi:MAG TPA: 3-phosphoserine/phosphohydroxythreonine transaminase [Vicinamibacterales bacterium]|nr:3-phosphoserine/phosphohydroxythreonine transaminase [Vicinamibacterales bacterium]